MAHLVIIGNGVTGTTVAREVRKTDSKIKITVISNETKYFFSRTALMYIFMGQMRYEHTKPYEDWFWEKNRIELVFSHVTEIDTDTKTLFTDNNQKISYDKLVVATGSKSNKFGWKGENSDGVQGFYSKQDLDLMEKNTKGISHAVIIGGGLIGIEVAEMLHSRKIHVTFLVREKFYWGNILPEEEAILVGKHILENKLSLRLQTELKEILADENGKVRAILTTSGEKIPCQFVALTVGVSPNIDVVKKSKIETNRGVLVNDFLETNIPDVYSAGDCAEIKVEGEKNRFEQLWYTGKMQAQALAKTICGERTKYERGIWFNSAKFFDIEYQTYGFVANILREGEKTLYWEHKDGKHCIRLVYGKNKHEITGMNSFGIRFRHKTFEKWIAEKRTVEYVLENLGEAYFDPEFFETYGQELIEFYNQENEKKLILKGKKGFFAQLFD